MGVNDGSVLGSTRILNNGPDGERYNVILVAEGYTSGQQNDFNDKCDEFVEQLQSDRWLGALLPGINVYRINVESDEAGLDDPDDPCNGTGEERATYFDASTCTGWPTAIRRLSRCNSWLVASVCDQEAPAWHTAIVLINTDLPSSDPLSGLRAGSGGQIATVTTGSSDWKSVVLHELGHSAFGLADEYTYWSTCSPPEPDRDHPLWGLEPWEPNLTRALSGFPPQVATERDHLKWGHLVNPETPVPTARNPDCSECPPENNPLPTSREVGLFEGAGYYHCDLFRPAFSCRMRSSRNPFCFVCAEAIYGTLRSFLPAGVSVAADVEELDAGSLCPGESTTLRFKIANVGTTFGEIAVTTDNDVYAASWESFGVNSQGQGPVLVGEDGLIPGQMADVTVQVGPIDLPTAVSSQTFAATITVAVDGGSALSVPITTTVCHPNAVADIAPTVLDFGHVADGLTTYRGIRVANAADCCPIELDVTVEDPTGDFTLTPDTPTAFTLAPGASEWVYVAFTAESAPATSTGSVTIRTNDSNADTVIVPLDAQAVAPVAVDSVLVVDRSFSMDGPTGETGRRKIDHAIFAGDLYVSLLRESDRIGVVRFNQHANEQENDVLLPLTEAGPQEDGAGRVGAFEQLNAAPNTLEPSGQTSIGAGTVLGSEVLNDAVSDARALVVLTDGRENVGTTIDEATAIVGTKSPTQRVFVVGLGLDQLTEPIENLATVNNGSVAITGELSADREFLLQKLFVQILSDIGDTSFVRDPPHTLHAEEKHMDEVFVGEIDLTADFIVVNRPGGTKYSRMWLEAPNGTQIRPDDIDDYLGASYVERDTHRYFRVSFPLFDDDPSGHVGQWRVWMHNTATEAGTRDAAPLVYTVMSRTYGDLRCDGWLKQLSHEPGAVIEGVVRPTLYSLPVAAMTPVMATVTTPDDAVHSVLLQPDDEYVYRGHFEKTSNVGLYHVECEVGVLTPSGVPVTRTRYLTGFILPPAKPTVEPKTSGLTGQRPRSVDLLERFINDRLRPFRSPLDHLRRWPQ